MAPLPVAAHAPARSAERYSKFDRAHQQSVLYDFTGGAHGGDPQAGLIRDNAGNLYGTTYYGGAIGAGTVFRLDPTGKETVLYSFTGGADGGNPTAGLIRDPAGNLYGTTYDGGNFKWGGGCGVVFKLDTAGKQTVLHTFTCGADGANPQAGLLLDSAGNLYGTASVGGVIPPLCENLGCGTVFKINTAGKFTVLHTFTGAPDGAIPSAPLTSDSAGNLYGTTYAGGNGCGGVGCGTVFKLLP